MNAKNDVTKDYNITTISKNIRELKHKHSNEIKYSAQKYKRSKYFKTLKEAQRFVDLVCIELKKPQVYNTFKSI